MALVEASAPTPHLGTACYYGGWASLKQCWKTKDASFSLIALPVSLHTSLRKYTHVRCTYVDMHVASLRGTGVLVILHLPNNKKKQLDFNQTFRKSHQQVQL